MGRRGAEARSAVVTGRRSWKAEAMTAAWKIEPVAADPAWEALQRAPVAQRPATREQVAAAEALLDDILSGRAKTVPLDEVQLDVDSE